MRTRITGALCVALFLASARTALGAGFSLQDFDAKSLGMSNAFAATANDPAANYYNPAGLSQLDGMQGSGTVTVIDPHTSYKADPGEGANESATESPIVVPALFGSVEIPGAEWLHLGLGMFAPYGLSIQWGKLWSGRYIIDRADIQALEWNANVAVKYQFAADQFISFAAGGSIVEANALLTKAVDQRFLGADDARAKIKMANDGNVNTRWNVAALLQLKLADIPVRLGLGYRDGVHGLTLRGRAEFTNVATNPVTNQPILPSSTGARAQTALPSEVRGGIAVDPIEPLTIELDYRFQHWSVVKDVGIKFKDGQGDYQTNTIHFNFRDASFVALGAEYRMNLSDDKDLKDFLAFRGGIYWDESPTTHANISPALPDNDRLGFSVGLGFHPIKPLSIDVGYLAVYIKRVTKRNDIGADAAMGGEPRANGKYDTWANLFSVTIGLQF